MMYLLAFVFAGMFTVDVVLHLNAIVKSRETIRRLTKIILMPLLATTFCCMWIAITAKPLPWLMIVAFLFGCIGDTCLINHHHPIGFPLGLAAFSIGHVLYIMQLFSLVWAPAWYMTLLIAFIYVSGALITFKKLSLYLPKRYVAASLFYMLLLCILSATSMAGILTSLNPGSVILAVGTHLFMISDTILSYEIFKGNSENGNLKVMITYIAAQICIAAGFFLWIA